MRKDEEEKDEEGVVARMRRIKAEKEKGKRKKTSKKEMKGK